MKIFLSYASQDSEPAKSIYLALRDQGHKVFFDRADLPAGEEYHNRIRSAVEGSDLFVFLISANAIDAGSYTLTELSIAEKAGVKMLPVALGKIVLENLPALLKAVTFLQTDGNLPATVAAEVHRIAGERRSKRLKYFALALLVAGVVIGAVLYGLRGRDRTARTGKDGALAVLIPAGSFVAGDDENTPRRELFVEPFYLDKYEVTVGRYASFLKATGNLRPPEDWETVDLKNDADLPVVGVDWQDASSYCQWVGRRLPTDAEWERAARGDDERKFPWGDEAPTAEHARFGQKYGNGVYRDGVARVGSHPKGASPFGIQDMSGNAWEWVADWFSESFPSADRRNPKGPSSSTDKVMRGGGWYDQADQLVSSKRMHANPGQRDNSIGFRCASDAK
jgi:formylglycine-generating enzyme required for sulfatase activity